MNQKKLANLGLFAAVAIIFGYVESLIPFFAGIPGIRLEARGKMWYTRGA